MKSSAILRKMWRKTKDATGKCKILDLRRFALPASVAARGMADGAHGHAGASTSALAPFHAPESVTSALSLAKTDADDAVWKAATEAALVWLLSLAPPSPAAVPDDKGKAKEEPDNLVHWFCGKQGAEECYGPAVFLIRLFAFKRTGQIDTWRRTFEK